MLGSMPSPRLNDIMAGAPECTTLVNILTVQLDKIKKEMQSERKDSERALKAKDDLIEKM